MRREAEKREIKVNIEVSSDDAASDNVSVSRKSVSPSDYRSPVKEQIGKKVKVEYL